MIVLDMYTISTSAPLLPLLALTTETCFIQLFSHHFARLLSVMRYIAYCLYKKYLQPRYWLVITRDISGKLYIAQVSGCRQLLTVWHDDKVNDDYENYGYGESC